MLLAIHEKNANSREEAKGNLTQKTAALDPIQTILTSKDT